MLPGKRCHFGDQANKCATSRVGAAPRLVDAVGLVPPQPITESTALVAICAAILEFVDLMLLLDITHRDLPSRMGSIVTVAVGRILAHQGSERSLARSRSIFCWRNRHSRPNIADSSRCIWRNASSPAAAEAGAGYR